MSSPPSPLPTLLLAASLLAAAPASAADGYALVVTNNRSLDPARPDLQYADDDGVKYAELFSEVYGEGHVVLLTQVDEETAKLYPRWAKAARAPTAAALDQAVAELKGKLEAAGRANEVHVVFAGHGDIDHGMGYVELMDGRLTARDLEARIVQRLPARRLHLILDSCNSYFMLNPRKPGGQRWATAADESQSLLRRYPHVGAVISTSAEAVTYEWSDLQSGIFSYEVRSGLRGAADADGDGRISYPELAAFISVANRPVVNDLYRPKVFSAAPLADARAAILTLDATAARTLTLPAAGQRRLTLRDENGVRVMDLNKEDRTLVTLALPRGAEEIGVYEQVESADAEKGRPTVRYRSIDGPGPVVLDDLPASPSPIAVRGSEAPVFRGLFREPYGKEAYAKVQANLARTPPALPFGVSSKDAERLRTHLEAGTSGVPGQQATGVLIASGGILAGGAVWGLSGQLESPDGRVLGQVLGATGAGSAVVAGVVTAIVPAGQESLFAEYMAQDLSTEEARTRAVLGAEAKFESQVQGQRQARAVAGWLLIGAGTAQAAAGTYVLATAPQGTDVKPAAVAYLGAGAFGILEGLVLMKLSKSPMEKAWDLYVADPSSPGGVRMVELGAGPGVVGVSVNGRF